MTDLLVLGSTILAIGPFIDIEDDPEVIASDAIYPKHVIEGYKIVSAKLPTDFTPSKYEWNGTEIKLKPEPIVSLTKEECITYAQELLDTEAQKLGYDSILSAVSYAGNHNPVFSTEGDKFKTWRSDVWAKCFEIEGLVLSGDLPAPTTKAEFLALLPKLPE